MYLRKHEGHTKKNQRGPNRCMRAIRISQSREQAKEKQVVQGQDQDSRKIKTQQTHDLVLLQHAKRFRDRRGRGAQDGHLHHRGQAVHEKDERSNSRRPAKKVPVEIGGCRERLGPRCWHARSSFQAARSER